MNSALSFSGGVRTQIVADAMTPNIRRAADVMAWQEEPTNAKEGF